MTAPTQQRAHDISRPTIREARDIGFAEWAAMQTQLDGLTDDDWCRPTPCAGWTVHMLLRHVVATYEEGPRPWLLIRRIRRGRRTYPQLNSLDGRNACQVDDLARLSNLDLKAEHARLGQRGIRALCRMPAPLRRLKLSAPFSDVPPQPEDTLDFLVRVLATRDAWMHRIDVADAIGRPPQPTEHDSAVVAQVVRDISSLWSGQPLILTLTGHAGGSWTVGGGDPVGIVTADGIDFMRHVSGRLPANRPTCDGDSEATANFTTIQIPF